MRISELLPDPAGSDDGEFIELENPSSAPATLTELQVRDAGGTKHALSGTLAANGFVALPKSATGITLNNDGDTASLVWTPSGQAEQVLDAATYEAASEGESFARFTAGFAWTTTPTPGAANVLTAPPADDDGTPADGTGTPGTGSEIDQAGGGGYPQPQPIWYAGRAAATRGRHVGGGDRHRRDEEQPLLQERCPRGGRIRGCPGPAEQQPRRCRARWCSAWRPRYVRWNGQPPSERDPATLYRGAAADAGSAPKPVTVKVARLGKADVGWCWYVARLPAGAVSRFTSSTARTTCW
ncbi:MAG: lamin tail domain-containing protein [Candidatus Andersenbacteria bacterium]